MKTTMMVLVTGALAAGALLPSPEPVAAQAAVRPYVADGEQLVYAVRSSRFGGMGTATMRVDADTVDGRSAYRLSFDFSAKVLLFKVSDRTRSWVDAETLTTLRYSKRERSPVGSFDEDVHILPETGLWHDGEGSFALASTAPLDELAFIYYVRSVADDIGADGATVRRHFDADRNPVQLHALGRARIVALGDSMYASVIRMDARDARQKNGTTRMTFYISENDAHLPLRIDTSMPMAGTLTMTLQSVVPGVRVRERITAMSRPGTPGSATGRQN